MPDIHPVTVRAIQHLPAPDVDDGRQVEFILQDYPGDFDQVVTVMRIDRGLNESWRTVEGDFFGATGYFSTQLTSNPRRRLVVENTETGLTSIRGLPTSSGENTVEIGPDGENEIIDLGPVLSVSPSVRSISETTTHQRLGDDRGR